MLVCDGNGSGECSNKMIIFYYIKRALIIYFFFFFNDPAPPEIYPLPLHDALPICLDATQQMFDASDEHIVAAIAREVGQAGHGRTTVVIGENEPQDSRLARPPQRGGGSEEHTSELQSPCNLVCRLLLEKKKKARPSSGGGFSVICSGTGEREGRDALPRLARRPTARADMIPYRSRRATDLLLGAACVS